MLNKITILILALVAPLLLLPIEQFWPYPALFEEVVKLAGVYALRSQTNTPKSLWGWSLLLGGLFALSETILYLMNIFTLGDLSLIQTRLLWTTSLHLVTISILTMGVILDKKRLGLWTLVSLAVAMGIHYGYNWGLS